MSHRLDVAIAVVRRGPRVLICQRLADASFPHFWEFPGGKREPGETVEQCLHREMAEELALPITVHEIIQVVEHDYTNVRIRLHAYWCEPARAADEPTPIQCQQLKWVLGDELAEYRFPPASEPLVQAIRQRLLDGP
jgi:mutator protein MutT